MRRVGILALLLLAVGCNNDRLAPVSKPDSTPTPTPGPNGSPPVAVIAGESVVTPGTDALFDGTGSYDPDGQPLAAYAWALTARPPGSSAVVSTSAGNPAVVTINADVAGDYTISLTVTDVAGMTGSSDVTFGAVPTGGLRVELAWPTQYTKVDLDNHLIDLTDNGAYFSTTLDCFFGNCTSTSQATFGYAPPDWFGSSSAGDDPHLDGDNVNAAVPENITIAAPHDGTYQIGIHYYGQNTGGQPIPAAFTVKVYASGNVIWTGTGPATPLSKKQLWKAANVVWSGGSATVTPVNQVITIP